MQPLVFEYRPAAFEALQAAVVTAFETGAPQVVLDLDNLPCMDADTVRGLITLLRTPNTLSFDRVFPMVNAA